VPFTTFRLQKGVYIYYASIVPYSQSPESQLAPTTTANDAPYGECIDV